jgi:hypothetical protein
MRGERLLRTYEVERAQKDYYCDGDGTFECKQACGGRLGCLACEMIIEGQSYAAEVYAFKYKDDNGKNQSIIYTKRWRLDCPHYSDDEFFEDEAYRDMLNSLAEIVPIPAPKPKSKKVA